MATDAPQLKVGAHVLVQLGSELVTDVEQAILECVKNSYDADSEGCLIEIDTLEKSTRIEEGTAHRLRNFDQASETVQVALCSRGGAPLHDYMNIADDDIIQRRLSYTGRITIEDYGDGLTPIQLETSWLVISQSSKRNDRGLKKQKTKLGRTPLGDKGLGRLGSMKLGDILLIETATSPSSPIASAQFRWADCESAQTVDEIPVHLSVRENAESFKGTRVSVLGLKDLAEWQRKDRIYDITKSLAKLISPFEATSTFPVKVSLDGVEQSLVTLTDELLRQAIAEFTFEWKKDPKSDAHTLVAKAKFRKRLFTSKRSRKAEDRTRRVFEVDDGQAFAEYLPSYKRMAAYSNLSINVSGPWFIELERRYNWNEIQPLGGASVDDPGPFSGAFHFFHLDNLDDQDVGAASGFGVSKDLIRSMSGISILRDGFRVRSQGDWLEIATGMTSGSTYNMRPDNTVGYFSLTGEENYRLVEKSDREGFVEDAALRGFLQLARTCRNFANDAMEAVRRGLDEYARAKELPKTETVAQTAEGSLQIVEDNLRSVREAKEATENIATQIQTQIDEIQKNKKNTAEVASQALRLAANAIKAMDVVRSKLSQDRSPELNLIHLRHELEDRNERALLLLEGAAVGLSARGLAHELRTHLTEIRQRVATLEKIAKKGEQKATIPNLRAIRTSCNAIANAVALIDPMLPRARALKETIDLRELFENYFKTRELTLDRAGIKTTLSGSSSTVRANRSRLIQVIDNMVRNSIYWLRRGEATGEIDRPKQISVKLTSSGFALSDSGPGVDQKYEEILFDIFVTAKPERDTGQGLGLFIIKQLLEVDGCDVRLLSTRNKEGRRYMFEVNLGPLVKA